MTKDANDNMRREIEAGEAWLAEVMQRSPAPPLRGLESVKHRVRIEVDESAIAFGATPEVRPTVVEQVKQAVRAELATAGAGRGPAMQRASWWIRRRAMMGTLAAAAVVALLLTPVLLWDSRERAGDRPTPSVAPTPAAELAGVDQAWDDFESVLSGESELETELSSLDTAIESLREGTAWSTDVFDAFEDEVVEGADAAA